MGDPLVSKWLQRGNLAMWICGSNYSDMPEKHEWNIAADEEACDAMFELLDLMENGLYSSKKELLLSQPEITATSYPGSKHKAAASLTIKYPKGRIDDDHWELCKNGRDLILTIGLSKFEVLRKILFDMKNYNGDYCIKENGKPLWVWWWVDES